MSPDERAEWERDVAVPSDFTGVHPVKLAPDAESSARRGIKVTVTDIDTGEVTETLTTREFVVLLTPEDHAVLVRERDEARAEAERLRVIVGERVPEATYVQMCEEADREMLRAEAAEAREAALRKAVEGLADEWALTYSGAEVNAWTTWASKNLRAVLASVPVPTDEAGFVHWDRGRELAEEFIAKDQTLTEVDIRHGQKVATELAAPTDEAGARCGSDGGQGIGSGHRCSCNRKAGHPLDSERPHGCGCGAMWACSDCAETDDTLDGCAECEASR